MGVIWCVCVHVCMCVCMHALCVYTCIIIFINHILMYYISFFTLIRCLLFGNKKDPCACVSFKQHLIMNKFITSLIPLSIIFNST